MFNLVELAICLLLPATVAWLAHALCKRIPSSKNIATAIAIGAGAAVGCLVVTTHTAMVARQSAGDEAALASALADTLQSVRAPRVAREWLPGFCLAAIVAAWFSVRLKWLSFWFSFALFTLIPWRLLQGSIYLKSEWSLPLAVAWIGSVAAVGAGLTWLAQQRTSDEDKHTWACQTIALLGMAIVTSASGSLTYGQVGLVFTGACAAGAIAAWWPSAEWSVANASNSLVTLVVSLLCLAYFFAELSTLNGLLLLAATAAALGVPAETRRSSVLKSVSVIVLTAIPLAIAIVQFWRETNANPYS